MNTTDLPTKEMNSQQVSKEQLINDFKVVVNDVEALVSATAHQGSDAIKNLRHKAEESIAKAKVNMSHMQEKFVDKAKSTAVAADEYAHKNPWEIAGVAAGIGLIVGLLIGRR
jgi:ElaB/YqjD/DUF883 family membrane-anchored ribosome-binding protein